MKFEATANKNGRLYRCKITDKNTKKSICSKSVKLIITDIKRQYGYDLSNKVTKGLLQPIAVDGYIYVSSYNSKYINEIKNACTYINKNTGLKCFIYTNDRHIADIIIMDWNSNKYTPNNMYTKLGTGDLLRGKEANLWAGVTFSNTNGEHFLIALNRKYLYYYAHKMIVAIIVHELGHCIGIPHSNDVKSIMHAIAYNYTMTNIDRINFIKQIETIKCMCISESGNSKIFTCYGVT